MWTAEVDEVESPRKEEQSVTGQLSGSTTRMLTSCWGPESGTTESQGGLTAQKGSHEEEPA